MHRRTGCSRRSSNSSAPRRSYRSARTCGALRVDKVFDRARIELLLDLIGHFPAKSAGEDRARLEDALSLASTLATTGPEPVRLRVVAGLCKVAPTQRVAVATLAEIGAARPELWTLIHGPLGALARTSKAVQRYLHENAGPGQTWVARARDLHGQELERFRRLAVDYAAGGKRAAIVRPELEQHVRAELDFLAHAAHPSGRFKWLAAHHSALASFYTDRDLEMLFDAADRGADAVQLLLARFALGWADTGGQDDAIKRVLTELGREAREDPAAREALLGVFTELELAGDEASLTPGRRQLKRDTYLALMAAAADNYEVVRMLKTRGIEPGRYGT